MIEWLGFWVISNMFHSKTLLFVVYKCPLRIETVVIKLNEIKVFEVLFSQFRRLLHKEKVN